MYICICICSMYICICICSMYICICIYVYVVCIYVYVYVVCTDCTPALGSSCNVGPEALALADLHVLAKVHVQMPEAPCMAWVFAVAAHGGANPKDKSQGAATLDRRGEVFGPCGVLQGASRVGVTRCLKHVCLAN